MGAGWIRARAPATIANLGPGFDVFVLAVRGPADEVAVRPATRDSLQVHGVEAAGIPSTFSGNTAGIAIEALRAATGISQALEIRVVKGIPPGRGLGSSAGSCAAAALAFLKAFPKSRDLGIAGVLRAAVEGDAALAGRCLEDRFAEPVRAPFLDGYAEARSAALKAGATGFALCGSGSSVFAFAPNSGVAGSLAEAMCDAFRSRGHAATPLVTAVDNRVPSAGLLPPFGRRFSVLLGRGPPSISRSRPSEISSVVA